MEFLEVSRGSYVTLFFNKGNLQLTAQGSAEGEIGEDGEQPVSGADLERTYEALASGMTLVVSLWSSEDLEWLYARSSS